MHTRLLKVLFSAAVQSCRPDGLIPDMISVTPEYLIINHHHYSRKKTDRVFVVAAGKAAAAMALEIEKIPGLTITDGLCITKYHHALPLSRIRTIEAAHPEPDENSFLAGHEVLRMLSGLTENDLVLFLISGGTSALLTDLPEGTNPDDLKKGYQLLINSGAGIAEINCVRKHLSRIKGGQLVRAAYPAQVVSLLISDVPGDNLETIGSGMTVPDPGTYQQAISVLEQYGLTSQFPDSLLQHLYKGQRGQLDETPKPGDPIFQRIFTDIIATNHQAATTAEKEALKRGYSVYLDKSVMTGDTNDEALAFTRKLLGYNGPLPAIFICGGETTLRVTHEGKGGRNQHFALRVLLELKKEWKRTAGFMILCAGTDGTDGPTDAAGALIHSSMLKEAGITVSRIQQHLDQFNAYPFFEETGGLFITGPTQTNVMDLVIGMVY